MSDFEERLKRIQMNLGTTKSSAENMKGQKKDFDKLDISIDTDMKLGGSNSSDSSDLEWDDTEKKTLLSERSCDMEFESVKSSSSSTLNSDKEMQVEGAAEDSGLSSSGTFKKQQGPNKTKSKALLKSQKQI